MSSFPNEMEQLRQRLESSQRLALIGSWESDLQHDYLYWSNEVYAILGLVQTETQPQASDFYERIHPADLAEVKLRKSWLSEAIPRVLFDHRIIRPDGEIRQVQQRAELVLDGSRRPERVIGTIQDITDRKAVEDELRHRTAVFEAQLNSSIDGILVVDDKGRNILQNDRFAELWRIPPELAKTENDEAQVQFVLTLLKNPEEFRAKITHLYSHPNEVSRDEVEMKDGTVLDRYSAPVIGKNGQYHGRIWTFRDATPQKIAQLALQASEERFKLVAKAIGEVIWDWNVETDTVWRSDNFENTFGLATATPELTQDTWEKLVHPDDRPRVLKTLRTALDGYGFSWSEEYRILRRDGSYAFVEDRGRIVRDGEHKAVRVVGGIRDLTEKKSLESRLLRAQRMEGIGTLAGGIAHDLNNVLAPILMSIDLLKNDTPGNAHAHLMLDIVRTSAQRGADLVKQVLTFARGTEGERVAIGFRRLFSDLENIVNETFPRNIRTVFDAPSGLRPVMGDATEFNQVLLNLAVNARDAMPEGGTLTFTALNTKIGDYDPEVMSGADAGDYVLLTVSDTGTGMSPETCARIFEPFFTTKAVGKGTGLGLASVQAIVKSYRGFAKVDSTLGEGTTFKIYLPAASPEHVHSRPPMLDELPRGQGETVLLIDDERSIRDITQQTLEAFGYRVVVAGDGIEGIAAYARYASEIAVVITDMIMPNRDGPSTIHALLQIDPKVRIIATSGMEMIPAETNSVHDFLAKPYTAATMLSLLRTVLDRPPAAS